MFVSKLTELAVDEKQEEACIRIKIYAVAEKHEKIERELILVDRLGKSGARAERGSQKIETNTGVLFS